MRISNHHDSVFKLQAIEALNINLKGTYVDCTIGYGGHSDVILNTHNFQGIIIGFDRDINAINFLRKKYEENKNVILIHCAFSNLKRELESLNMTTIDGFIFDLGVSSPQLDNKDRGFSYHGDSVLDMRMDQTQKLSAKNIINDYSLSDLTDIFNKYGECKHTTSVAKAIVKNRAIKPITTTQELVDIIKSSIPTKELYKEKHPARTYFQALRMQVNDELTEITKGLSDAINMLSINGRIVVISFHSLEDRTVKNVFHNYITSSLPSYLPLSKEQEAVHFKILKAPRIMQDEIDNNHRARSAKLRIIERISNE